MNGAVVIATETVASDLLALAFFSLVTIGTPGPNNILLWASGIQFGLRPSLPHVFGTSLGLGTMGIGVAAGLGALITTVPEVELALKAAGSIYLIYLAYKIAGSRATQRSDVARPLRLHQAVSFQYVNPKAWVFVLAAFTAFRPDGPTLATASAAMALVVMVVAVPAALIWAAGGTVINRLINTEETRRRLSRLLAVLLVVTVGYLWI
jgi:threonine/homoserine/homoserine lactone efflux protein